MRPPSTLQGAPASQQSPAAEARPAPQAPGVTTRYYDVTGGEPEVIRAQMRRLGPEGFFGHTKWWVSYQYRGVPMDGRCVLTKPEVGFKGEIIMPRWANRGGASTQVVAYWNRFEAALLVHEQGHIANGRDFERELAGALGAVAPAPDCATLDRAVKSLYDSLYQKYLARDKEYDRRTGHGRTQDANF